MNIYIIKLYKGKFLVGITTNTKYKIKQDILSEFSNETKSRNFVYAMSIDFLKNFFSFQNQSFKKFRNKIITSLNKSNFVKDVFFNLADKGLKF